MSNPNPTYKIPKGTTPNPNGRPKREWTVQGLIEDAMNNPVLVDGKEVPTKKIVYDKLVEMAKGGDIQAIKEVNQRLDGMPKQTIAGDSENPLALSIDISELIRKSYGKSKPGGST